jgi:hypothetical protein
MDGGRDVSLRPKKIKNTSAVLRAQVRILTTGFSLMLHASTNNNNNSSSGNIYHRFF